VPIQSRVRRVSLPDARADRLYFAQVREDPELEIEALRPGPDDTVVVVSSGGCTALSMLAAGAGEVVAVDLNPTQNHLLELKQKALAHLGREATLGFLGALPAPAAERQEEAGAGERRIAPTSQPTAPS
jgi:S-adenosylmethionine-diacylglycerol 3-amino-3-carboxypropyl transferase